MLLQQHQCHQTTTLAFVIMINVIYCINITDLFFFLPPSFCLYPYPSSLLRIMIDDLSQQHHHIIIYHNHFFFFFFVALRMPFSGDRSVRRGTCSPLGHASWPCKTGRRISAQRSPTTRACTDRLLCPFIRTKPPCKDEGRRWEEEQQDPEQKHHVISQVCFRRGRRDSSENYRRPSG